MGLLDELLGQLAGGAVPDRQPSRTQASSAGGMGPILMALMPVVLMMLRNRGSGGGQSAGLDRGGSGGELGDILGQVLGGAAGGGGGLGGLGGLLEQFQRAGFGDAVSSWIGTGANQPMPSGALDQVFGPGGLAEIARRAGLSEADTQRGLNHLMPEVINHVTPRGAVPQDDDLLASVDDLARRLGMRG